MEATSDDTGSNVLRRIGSQPVALAAGALIVVVLAASSVGVWRGHTGNSPEQERLTSLRQMQARSTQASEQLFEKTKSLETSQQETIDQLQAVQEQLQSLNAWSPRSKPMQSGCRSRSAVSPARSIPCGNP